MGLVEVIDLDTGEPAAAGRARHGRGHPVLPLPGVHAGVPLRHPRRRAPAPRRALTCSLAGVPATSRILGKAGQLLRVGGRMVTPRELVEACEALPGEPWPARFSARAQPRPRSSSAQRGHRRDAVGRGARAPHRADAGGLPIVCSLVGGAGAATLRRLRADLSRDHLHRRKDADMPGRDRLPDRRRRSSGRWPPRCARWPTSATCALERPADRHVQRPRPHRARVLHRHAAGALPARSPPTCSPAFLVITFFSALMIALRPLVPARRAVDRDPGRCSRRTSSSRTAWTTCAAGCSSTGCSRARS